MNNKPENSIDARTILAFGITVIAVLGVVTLGLAIILTNNTDVTNRAQAVFNAVLPLFGTWVGTILAYYFARENYEAASRSAERLTRLTPQETLLSTPVAVAMVPKSQMVFVDDLSTVLVDILKDLTDKDVRRLPVLDKTGAPSSLIYREDILDYLYRIKDSLSDEQRKVLTVQNILIEHPEMQKPFAVIAESETLANAKEAMDKIPDCRDVLVTKSGDKNDAVTGLLTNIDIAKHSRA